MNGCLVNISILVWNYECALYQEVLVFLLLYCNFIQYKHNHVVQLLGLLFYCIYGGKFCHWASVQFFFSRLETIEGVWYSWWRLWRPLGRREEKNKIKSYIGENNLAHAVLGSVNRDHLKGSVKISNGSANKCIIYIVLCLLQGISMVHVCLLL
jgi:hypothetical protein